MSTFADSLLVATFFFAGAVGGLRAQTLEVVPDHILVDETATIRVKGLQQNQ